MEITIKQPYSLMENFSVVVLKKKACTRVNCVTNNQNIKENFDCGSRHEAFKILSKGQKNI